MKKYKFNIGGKVKSVYALGSQMPTFGINYSNNIGFPTTQDEQLPIAPVGNMPNTNFSMDKNNTTGTKVEDVNISGAVDAAQQEYKQGIADRQLNISNIAGGIKNLSESAGQAAQWMSDKWKQHKAEKQFKLASLKLSNTETKINNSEANNYNSNDSLYLSGNKIAEENWLRGLNFKPLNGRIDKYKPYEKSAGGLVSDIGNAVGDLANSLVPMLERKSYNVMDIIGATGKDNIFNEHANGGRLNKFGEGTSAKGGGPSTGDKVSTIVNAAGDALNLYGTINAQSLLDTSLEAVNAGLGKTSEKIASKQKIYDDSSWDNLSYAYANQNEIGHLDFVDKTAFTNDTIGSVAMKSIGNGGKGAAIGAAAGSVIPGIGTAAGAIVGGIAGTIGSLFGSGSKEKKANLARDKANMNIAAINQQVDYNNEFNARGLDNAFENIANRQALNALMNFAAEGAELKKFNIKPINPSVDTKMTGYNTNFAVQEPKNTNKFDPIRGTAYSLGGVFDISEEQYKQLLKEGYIIEKV